MKKVEHQGEQVVVACWRKKRTGRPGTQLASRNSESIHTGTEGHNILVEQESISSGEVEELSVLTKKKNEIPISSFILEAATDTDSSENNAGLNDYTQTQTTVKSISSEIASRNSGGKGDGEKASRNSGGKGDGDGRLQGHISKRKVSITGFYEGLYFYRTE